MSKQERTTLAVAVLTALPTGGVIAFWLFSAAFVPQSTYKSDRHAQSVVNDSLRNTTNTVREDIRIIKCYTKALADQVSRPSCGLE